MLHLPFKHYQSFYVYFIFVSFKYSEQAPTYVSELTYHAGQVDF